MKQQYAMPVFTTLTLRRIEREMAAIEAAEAKRLASPAPIDPTSPEAA